jgi:hypothetical protein
MQDMAESIALTEAMRDAVNGAPSGNVSESSMSRLWQYLTRERAKTASARALASGVVSLVSGGAFLIYGDYTLGAIFVGVAVVLGLFAIARHVVGAGADRGTRSGG